MIIQFICYHYSKQFYIINVKKNIYNDYLLKLSMVIKEIQATRMINNESNNCVD